MRHVLASLHTIINALEGYGLYSEADTIQSVFTRLATKKSSKDPVDAIIAYAKTIKHCGDYGDAFWNAEEGHVWWNCADSDGSGGPDDEDNFTDLGEIEAKFSAIPGVNKVSVEAEASPSSEGWEMVYPRREKVRTRPPRDDKDPYGMTEYLDWCKEAFDTAGRTVQAAIIGDVLIRLAADKLEKLVRGLHDKRLKFTRQEAKAILGAAGFTILDEDETHIKAYSDELRGIGGDMEKGTITVGCHYNNKRDAVSQRGHSDIEKAINYILHKRSGAPAMGGDMGEMLEAPMDATMGEDWQTGPEDTRYDVSDYRRYLPPAQRAASMEPLLRRFASVISEAEDSGMTRVASILQTAFEQLAA